MSPASLAISGKALALLAALAAVVLWASSFSVMKRLLELGLPPMLIIWIRLAVAAVLLLPFLLHGWRRAEKRRGDLLWLLLMAAFEPGLYFVLEITALQYTSSAQAGIIVAIFPLLAALGGAFFFREHLTARMLAGLALAVIGAAGMTLAGGADDHAPAPWLGNLLEFFAISSAVGYMLIVKRLSPRWPVWSITAAQMLLGALFFLPATGALADPAVRTLALRPEPLALLLWLGVGVTVLAYGLYNFSVSRLTAAQAAVFVNLMPVLAALMGWAWLGERLAIVQVAFAALILAGVALAESGRNGAAREIPD